MEKRKKLKILFGVFDWGLGHATRDIPVISELLKKNRVDILSTGRALNFLKTKFGRKCRYFDVVSVTPPYTKHTHSMIFTIKFSFSSLSMYRELKQARKASEQVIKKGKYDIVISDCRYDVYDRKDNSFLINHQLMFKAGNIILEKSTIKFLSSVMEKYCCIIVPDFPDRELTGQLSHNPRFKGRVEYIGILSHLKKKKIKEDIDYFFSISGPEPQRSIFEKKIIEQIKYLKGSIVLACGNPDSKTEEVTGNTKFCSVLNTEQQEDMMNRAKTIISRPGYTTVMELVEIGKKKVLFVPTPGQTEQEYLADLYEDEKFFHHVHQGNLNLKEDLSKLQSFNGYKAKWGTKNSVKKFMGVLGLK